LDKFYKHKLMLESNLGAEAETLEVFEYLQSRNLKPLLRMWTMDHISGDQ
jgi:hypothetical protein